MWVFPASCLCQRMSRCDDSSTRHEQLVRKGHKDGAFRGTCQSESWHEGDLGGGAKVARSLAAFWGLRRPWWRARSAPLSRCRDGCDGTSIGKASTQARTHARTHASEDVQDMTVSWMA